MIDSKVNSALYRVIADMTQEFFDPREDETFNMFLFDFVEALSDRFVIQLKEEK